MLAEQVPLVADRHVQRLAVLTLVALLLMGQAHPELPVANRSVNVSSSRSRDRRGVKDRWPSKSRTPPNPKTSADHNDQLPHGPWC